MAYPLVTTADLPAAREFYTRHFGMQIVFEASWIVLLSDAGHGAITLGFMSVDHPSRPPGPETYAGQGMLLTIEVESADEMHDRLVAAGVPILYGVVDEPWGQRRFMTKDPAGLTLDVVQQIAPVHGWWDRYRTPG